MLAKLDPRTKFYLVLLGNLILFIHADTLTEMIAASLFLLILLLAGKEKTAVRLCILYFAMLSCEIWLLPYAEGFLANFLGMWSVGLRMMLPCLITGIYAFSTTSTGEWVCAMRKAHISEKVIIPSMVVIRFFPTVGEDLRQITGQMKLRGVLNTEGNILSFPVKYLEYVLMPVLMNAASAADDLSAAALTKGLGIEGEHTCMTEIGLRSTDYLVMAVCTLPYLLFLGGVL